MTDDSIADDLTERSRSRLDDLREHLEAEYGEFRLVEKTWRHPPHFYEDLVERFEGDRAGGAGAWVYDDDGRVLLVREEGAVGWSDPGGKRRAGESYEATARRVVREQAGVEVDLEGVLELHAVTVYDGTDPERPNLLEPIVVFEARYAGGDPRPPEEDGEVEWFEEPPATAGYEQVEERPIPFEG